MGYNFSIVKLSKLFTILSFFVVVLLVACGDEDSVGLCDDFVVSASGSSTEITLSITEGTVPYSYEITYDGGAVQSGTLAEQADSIQAEALDNYLGDESETKLKEEGGSGFEAKLADSNSVEAFLLLGDERHFWTSTEDDTNDENAFEFNVIDIGGFINTVSKIDKTLSLSIRSIKEWIIIRFWFFLKFHNT